MGIQWTTHQKKHALENLFTTDTMPVGTLASAERASAYPESRKKCTKPWKNSDFCRFESWKCEKFDIPSVSECPISDANPCLSRRSLAPNGCPKCVSQVPKMVPSKEKDRKMILIHDPCFHISQPHQFFIPFGVPQALDSR